MELGGWAYLAIFATTLVLSLFLTPLALRLAVRLGILDRPGGHKAHDSPVPYLGGLGIVVSFAAAVMIATAAKPPVDGVGELGAILGFGVVLAVVGFVDDVRSLGLFVRLAAQLAAAFGLYAAGVRVDLLPVDAANLAITVIWVVGITNAFNLLDNMDGLSAGVAVLAAGGFFLIAAVNGQYLVAGLAVALAGCGLGFLRSNFHPARIYMGDGGALFLGFVLAAIGIKLRFDAPQEVTLFVPILVLGVAIFDTALVTVTRLLQRRNVFSGARDHVSHRLVAVGLPVPVAVGTIYVAGFSLAWFALVVSTLDTSSALLLVSFVGAFAALAAVLLSFVPVDERSTELKEDDTEELPPVRTPRVRLVFERDAVGPVPRKS